MRRILDTFEDMCDSLALMFEEGDDTDALRRQFGQAMDAGERGDPWSTKAPVRYRVPR